MLPGSNLSSFAAVASGLIVWTKKAKEAEAAKIYMPHPIPEYALKSDITALNEKLDTLLDSLKKKEDLNNV